jgi:hypothetical protein
VSAVTTRISNGSIPRTSATTYASTESLPCPMSIDPQNTVTPPPRSSFSWTPDCGIEFQ